MAVNNTAFLAPILYSEIIITMENATDGTSLPNGIFERSWSCHYWHWNDWFLGRFGLFTRICQNFHHCS